MGPFGGTPGTCRATRPSLARTRSGADPSSPRRRSRSQRPHAAASAPPRAHSLGSLPAPCPCPCRPLRTAPAPSCRGEAAPCSPPWSRPPSAPSAPAAGLPRRPASFRGRRPFAPPSIVFWPSPRWPPRPPARSETSGSWSHRQAPASTAWRPCFPGRVMPGSLVTFVRS